MKILQQKTYVLMAAVILTSNTTQTLTIPDATLEEISNKPTELIIFIHGTMPAAQWNIGDFFKILHDKIENSLYQISTRYIRQDPFFRRGQAMQDEGLVPIPFYDQENCAALVARMHEQQYEWIAQKHPEKNYATTRRCYYTFGWNGLLHIYTRYEAAKKLYKELLKELNRLETLGITNPRIRIITFSHGGNIALNLAAVQTDHPEFLEKPITIDELVMFATPVQKATDYLTHSPLFKRIYHFYSVSDQMQTMDFTSPNQWFAKRLFKKQRYKDLPESLTQIQMRITKEIQPKKRTIRMPEVIDYFILNDPHFKPIYDDPHHTEFWHFQWAAGKYRPSFAFAPFPVCTFAPTLVHHLKEHASDIPHVVFNCAPAYDAALITERHATTGKSFPFLSKVQLQALYEMLGRRAKETFVSEEEKQHLAHALTKAKNELQKSKS